MHLKFLYFLKDFGAIFLKGDVLGNILDQRGKNPLFTKLTHRIINLDSIVVLTWDLYDKSLLFDVLSVLVYEVFYYIFFNIFPRLWINKGPIGHIAYLSTVPVK